MTLVEVMHNYHIQQVHSEFILSKYREVGLSDFFVYSTLTTCQIFLEVINMFKEKQCFYKVIHIPKTSSSTSSSQF